MRAASVFSRRASGMRRLPRQLASMWRAAASVNVAQELRWLGIAKGSAASVVQQYRVIETEAVRLINERQAQATNLRVERTARDKLAMRGAGPANTQYVSDAGGPAR